MYCQNCGTYLQPIYRYCIKCAVPNSRAVTLYPAKRRMTKSDLLAWQNIVIINSPDRLVCNKAQLTAATTATAQRRLEIIRESQELVNTTVNPETYFSRYDLLYEQLIFLLRYEPYYTFAQGSPSESISHLCQAENDSNKAFIDRYFQKVSAKAQSLKTSKGKANQYHKFFDSLKPYFRRLSPLNIEYTEKLYKTALQKVENSEMLFDKRITNRERIQKDLNDISRLGTDLVTVSSHSYCSVCSQYKGIVYSISGTNRRYPKLPKEIVEQTHSCTEHLMSLIAFWEGISTPPHK